MEDRWLNVNQAAHHLGISKGTLYQYTHKKLVTHYKLGNRIMFKVSDLDKFMESNKVETMEQQLNKYMTTDFLKRVNKR